MFSRSGGHYLSVVALPKAFGSVDVRGRPLVRVALVGRDEDVLATIDTGFHGQAMMNMGDAVLLGVTILEGSRDVELGHGHSVEVKVGRMRVRWLELEQDVSVLISDREMPTRDGDPVLLMGTRLLAPHLLLTDFASGTVEIETQD